MHRSTIEFTFPRQPAAQRHYWLVVDPQEGVDLCKIDPGFEVDLYVSVDLRSMTAIWMGLTIVRREVEAGALELDGDPKVASAMQQWLGLSPFGRPSAAELTTVKGQTGRRQAASGETSASIR